MSRLGVHRVAAADASGSRSSSPRPRATTTRRRPPTGKGRSPGIAALRALVEDSSEGNVLADRQGYILYANAASERILGYPPADLVGRLGFDLCRPEHLVRAREAFSRCLTHPGRPIELTVDVQRAGGDFASLAVTLVNRLPMPGVKAVVAHFRETTGEPAAAEEDGPDYHAVFESAPIGLGVADLEGNLLAFNDAMLTPGGYAREDIVRLGNVAHLYRSSADRQRILDLARKQGFVWREEVQFRRKDGSAYDALLSLTPVRLGNRPCWCAAVEDITERKLAEGKRLELEAQLRQAQKMEAVGRMTGGIAHDFNNFLSIIMANAELVALALDPEATDAHRSLLELRRAAERGAGMIRKLLGFSRNTDLSIHPIHLGEMARGAQGMLRRVVPEEVALEVIATDDSTALCDPDAVEQVLLNLATNARDAMPHGGTLRIAVSPFAVDRDMPTRPSWLTPGAFVRLSVSDTGVGMDERTRARAFEPFFTTKPPGTGTGLGLSMAYGLVKQQGGFIDLVSTPGTGTTVHLYFPRTAAAPRRRRVGPAPGAQAGGPATILLLEDDESVQRTVRRVLEHLGYRVLVAADGSKGLDLFRAHQAEIDLVISDLLMPGLTGVEVYEAIQKLSPSVPVLLSSGYEERPDGIREVPAGLRVIAKPWTIEQLARTVSEALAPGP